MRRGSTCVGLGRGPVLLQRTSFDAHSNVLAPQKQETVNILIQFNSVYSKSIIWLSELTYRRRMCALVKPKHFVAFKQSVDIVALRLWWALRVGVSIVREEDKIIVLRLCVWGGKPGLQLIHQGKYYSVRTCLDGQLSFPRQYSQVILFPFLPFPPSTIFHLTFL